jgi:hypothetical protein
LGEERVVCLPKATSSEKDTSWQLFIEKGAAEESDINTSYGHWKCA